MPMYCHTARVTSRGPFPIDMLRYDSAYPLGEGDAATIAHSLEEYPLKSFTVEVAKRCTSKIARWTHMRWKSFGCTVEEIETVKRT